CSRPAAVGVSVEAVDPEGAAARAGVRPRDALLSWHLARGRVLRGPSGALESPFDVAITEMERGPRGPVVLSLRRDGRAMDVTLSPGPWGLTARPAAGADSALGA